MSIVATSARVAVPFGASVVVLLPCIKPWALAHVMASSAHDDISAVSLYAERSVVWETLSPFLWA